MSTLHRCLISSVVRLLLIMWLCAAAPLRAQPLEISGQIRLQTADGTPGQGVANVLVSNGRELVRSDASGRYRLALEAGQTLFVIKPAGYAGVRDSEGKPRFWRHHFPHGSPTLRYGGIAATAHASGDWDFTLDPAQSPTEALEVLVFGDPQPKSAAQVTYFERDIIEPILRDATARKADLGLTLGDVVHDDLSLLPAIQAATARLGVPWLHAAGNHDIDFDAAADDDSLLSFRQVFGPDTLAWEAPQAVFIVLDDVIYQPTTTPSYIGGLRESQFAFLEGYLATLDRTRTVVLATHIPFFDPHPGRESFRRADRERLFALLAPFPRVLLLSAHGHVQRHYFHTAQDGWHGDQPLHEYNVGATCGGFWGGEKDAEGLPTADMSDGTPNGYAQLVIASDGDYRLRWQVAREPGHPGIALHAPRALRQGAWPGVGLYANVLMGVADDRVEFRIDGGEWRAMTRVERTDPRVLAVNLADDAAERPGGDSRTPEATVSTHLWRAFLPTDLDLGEHLVEVRAQDRWRGELRAETRYRLLEAAP